MKLSFYKLSFYKICGLLGIVGTAAFAGLVALAIANHAGYSVFSNYLSDLGVGPSGALFNSGAIVSGLLNIAVGMALFKKYGNITGKTGGLLFALASILLVFLGIFTEESGITHSAFAASFFFLSAVSMFLVGKETMNSTRNLGCCSFLAGLAPLAFLLTTAQPVEHIAAAAVAVWVVVVSIKLIRP